MARIKNKEYKIEFEGESRIEDTQNTNISNRQMALNKTVLAMNNEVENLDRFDDFDSLMIENKAYARTGENEYGIQRKTIHNSLGKDTVIFPWQQAAAERFLKELRGFGLLADIVGSGKTYEAGMIISELAVRNKLNSMLIIVPDQVLYNWKRVIEENFGLGKDRLKIVKDSLNDDEIDVVESRGKRMPTRPLLVTIDDFAKWDESTADYLFDVIIVDEAHHLCEEGGKYAKAMKLLSLFMQTKKEANSTYCLLLTATPHSGNLTQMFRLWYFVRSKGGHPSDFDEKDDSKRTEEYRIEKQYYHDSVCEKADTVMEFTKNVKRRLVRNDQRFLPAFEEFLNDKGITLEQFDALNSPEQHHKVEDFIRKAPKLRNDLLSSVSSAYHNGVLRSIMIRQKAEKRTAKKKKITNILFYPTTKELPVLAIRGLDGEDINIDTSKLDSEKLINDNGDYKSLRQYVIDNLDSDNYSMCIGDMYNDIFKNFKDEENLFHKYGSISYYVSQLKECPNSIDNRVVFYKEFKPKQFQHKYEYMSKILDENKNDRVILFFDYSKKKDESILLDYLKQMQSDKRYNSRLLITGTKESKIIINEFRAKSDAILFVTSADFTEGADLQCCKCLINVESTCDPLAMDQRIGRIFRLGQENDVDVYSFADMDKLEGYGLMYFARIGLLNSTSGDATIIAGSNNEHMVPVRCPKCGNVELLSQEEYALKKEKDDLYCTTMNCLETHEKMEEITIFDFKCDTCNSVFSRSSDDEGYYCLSENPQSDKGVMCSSGKSGDRALYCHKKCAMLHCKANNIAEECPVVKKCKESKNVTDAMLLKICATCKNYSICPSKCHFRIGKDAILDCHECSHSTCRPAPYVLEFNEKWECSCPKCEAKHNQGTIRMVKSRNFEAFIKGLWNFSQDGGKTFCEKMLKEADKVSDIKMILDSDKEER